LDTVQPRRITPLVPTLGSQAKGSAADDARMSEKPQTHTELDSTIEKPESAPARSSVDTITDSEAARENSRHANPNGFARTSSGVDVKAAEEEFAHLQRELSGISQSGRLSRSQSKGGKGGQKDVEKGTSESTTEAEPFDLEHTLRGNHTVSVARFCPGRGGKAKIFGEVQLRLLLCILQLWSSFRAVLSISGSCILQC
jgi:hypothetical protein